MALPQFCTAVTTWLYLSSASERSFRSVPAMYVPCFPIDAVSSASWMVAWFVICLTCCHESEESASHLTRAFIEAGPLYPASSARATSWAVASVLPRAYWVSGAMVSLTPRVKRLFAIPAVRHVSISAVALPTADAKFELSWMLAALRGSEERRGGEEGGS